MRRAARIVSVAFVTVVAAYLILGLAFSIYDRQTMRSLVSLSQRELPPQASMGEMDRFMRKHTEEYSPEEDDPAQFKGLVRQRKIDRILFDRKVYLALKFDKATRTYQGCAVEVLYTFL